MLGQLLLLQVSSCFYNPRGAASCTLITYNAQIECDVWPPTNLNAYDLLCVFLLFFLGQDVDKYKEHLMDVLYLNSNPCTTER